MSWAVVNRNLVSLMSFWGLLHAGSLYLLKNVKTKCISTGSKIQVQ